MTTKLRRLLLERDGGRPAARSAGMVTSMMFVPVRVNFDMRFLPSLFSRNTPWTVSSKSKERFFPWRRRVFPAARESSGLSLALSCREHNRYSRGSLVASGGSCVYLSWALTACRVALFTVNPKESWWFYCPRAKESWMPEQVPLTVGYTSPMGNSTLQPSASLLVTTVPITLSMPTMSASVKLEL